MKSATKYLTGGIGGLIGLVIFFYFSSHFFTQLEGDVACAGTYENICEWHYNVTLNSSVYNPFYIYNKEVNLNFVPEMKKVWHCKKDGRYKNTDRLEHPCGAGYREFNWSTPLTKKYAYIEKFEKGDKHEYKIVALKFNPSDEIKFGGRITGNNFDPKFLADIDVKAIYKCTTKYQESVSYVPTDIYKDGLICSDEPTNKSCVTGKVLYAKTSIRNMSIVSYQDCEIIGYNSGGKIIRFEDGKRKCYYNSPYITCKILHQSNLNYKKCLSGEGCEIIDARNNLITSSISDTKQIIGVKLE